MRRTGQLLGALAEGIVGRVDVDQIRVARQTTERVLINEWGTAGTLAGVAITLERNTKYVQHKP